MALPLGFLYHRSVPVTTSAAAEKKTELEASIRSELRKIVQSNAFRPVDRLQRFLSYIVEETLAGRGKQLKEYPVGVDVFGKDSSFDPRMDPIVRVQARRLRMRLVNYYASEGQADNLVIELPKGGYNPAFTRVEKQPVKERSIGAALVSRNTIAVLSFADDSPHGDERSFCNGLAQEVLRALSEVQSLVIKVNSGTGPQGAATAAMTISGSVRKSRDTLRITTHITDTVHGCYVWTDTVDFPVGETFAIQEAIARKVVETLRMELRETSPEFGLRPARTANLAAHNLYVQGRYHLSQRTEPGLKKALDFFTQAIKEDPGSAQAHAGLADAHNLLTNYGVSAPSEVWTKVASNASRAVLLDDDSSEAHTSLAHVKATQDWDWSGAEQEFRRAIALDPYHATAHHWFAMSCLAPTGRLDKALEEIKLAQACDPVSSIISRDIAMIYYYRRDYDAALEQCDHTIEQNPHFSAAYWTLGLVQEQLGEVEEAVAALQRAIELSPPSPRITGALGGVFAKEGKRDAAFRILGELKELSAKRYISPFEPSLIHFNMKMKDEGFALLTKAFEDRCFEMITIQIDPRFDAVRSDARFQLLFRKLNLS